MLMIVVSTIFRYYRVSLKYRIFKSIGLLTKYCLKYQKYRNKYWKLTLHEKINKLCNQFKRCLFCLFYFVEKIMEAFLLRLGRIYPFWL